MALTGRINLSTVLGHELPCIGGYACMHTYIHAYMHMYIDGRGASVHTHTYSHTTYNLLFSRLVLNIPRLSSFFPLIFKPRPRLHKAPQRVAQTSRKVPPKANKLHSYADPILTMKAPKP